MSWANRLSQRCYNSLRKRYTSPQLPAVTNGALKSISLMPLASPRAGVGKKHFGHLASILGRFRNAVFGVARFSRFPAGSEKVFSLPPHGVMLMEKANSQNRKKRRAVIVPGAYVTKYFP